MSAVCAFAGWLRTAPRLGALSWPAVEPELPVAVVANRYPSLTPNGVQQLTAEPTPQTSGPLYCQRGAALVLLGFITGPL